MPCFIRLAFHRPCQRVTVPSRVIETLPKCFTFEVLEAFIVNLVVIVRQSHVWVVVINPVQILLSAVNPWSRYSAWSDKMIDLTVTVGGNLVLIFPVKVQASNIIVSAF